MTNNLNIVDRALRLLLGVLLVGWAVLYSDMPYSYLGWIGAVLIATGLIGWCGLYKLFGLSTAK